MGGTRTSESETRTSSEGTDRERTDREGETRANSYKYRARAASERRGRDAEAARALSAAADDSAIRNIINKVLAHEAPVVFGTVAEDLESSLSELKSFGDRAAAHVRSAILSCASEQRGGPRWWDGAAELCKALAASGTPQASKTLLDVLEANSRVVEFDRVRAQAARCLGTFNDKSLVTRLVAASKLPNAPALAIKEAIDKLGGEPLQSPKVIIEEGRSMEPEEAIRFFESHQHAVDGWPKEKQGGFTTFSDAKSNASMEQTRQGLTMRPDYLRIQRQMPQLGRHFPTLRKLRRPPLIWQASIHYRTHARAVLLKQIRRSHKYPVKRLPDWTLRKRPGLVGILTN